MLGIVQKKKNCILHFHEKTRQSKAAFFLIQLEITKKLRVEISRKEAFQIFSEISRYIFCSGRFVSQVYGRKKYTTYLSYLFALPLILGLRNGRISFKIYHNTLRHLWRRSVVIFVCKFVMYWYKLYGIIYDWSSQIQTQLKQLWN